MLTGGAGDDQLAGRGGADVLSGGEGSDEANYSGSASGVTVDLALQIGSGGDAEGDTFSSIENVSGSIFDDHLIGDAGSNILSGGDGLDVASDTLEGGDGDDFLIGDALRHAARRERIRCSRLQ